jgi:hypothetical protein
MSWELIRHDLSEPIPGIQPADVVRHEVGTLILQGLPQNYPEVLTSEVRREIARVWGGIPADRFIEISVDDIAHTLDQILTDGRGYATDGRAKIAEELVRYIRRMLDVPASGHARALQPATIAVLRTPA